MRYSTELMREILQSPEAQRIIDFVAPIYGESRTALWLFEVIGRVLDSVTEAAESLKEQMIPHQATWALPYWEQEYGTVPEPDWSTAQRQENVLAKTRYVPPVNPKKLEEFASAAVGAPCRIAENVSKNTFSVEIEGHAGAFDRLYAAINEAKPAHLIWTISARTPSMEAGLFVAGAQTAGFSRTELPELTPA